MKKDYGKIFLMIFLALVLTFSGCSDSDSGSSSGDPSDVSDSDGTSDTDTVDTTDTGDDASTVQSDLDLNTSDLPEYFSISEDGKQLLRGKVSPDDFYKMSSVENFYLYFDSDDWFDELITATDSEEYLLATISYDGETLESVGIQFKGNTSYSQTEERKSFDVKLDYQIDGQDIDGYNTLNFNNAANDATYMREVFYVNQSRKHMPSANGNFINVYVNDEFWGVYSNIQQLNKDHLKQWYLSNEGTNWRASSSKGGAGASDQPTTDANTTDTEATSDNGFTPPVGGKGPGGGMGGGSFNDGTTALNYLGDDSSLYEAAYELKSTSSDSPYDYLVTATKSLDSITEGNSEEVSKVFDIDGALWLIAYEILFGDDDGYISKGAMDYYVYYDIATGKMSPVETDGNSVMNDRNAYDIFYRIDDETFPVAYKLLNIPKLRQRYLAHVRTILTESFDPTLVDPILDDYKLMIDEGVANDPHPHQGITYEGFDDAIDTVKDFIAGRFALLTENEELALEGPSISNVSHEVDGEMIESPSSSQSPTLSASVQHTEGIKAVYAYYGTGVVGTFTKIELLDDGAHSDGAANDGVFANAIPAQSSGTYVRYYIEAVANDYAQDYGSVSYLPVGAEHDVFLYRVALEVESQSDLVINEIMASNSSTVTDENGEFDDWVEIYNNSGESINLLGYYLSDDPNNLSKWVFPEMTLGAGEYLTLWLDEDEDQGEDHVNFKLSASGEDLLLSNPQKSIINIVTFTEQEADISYGRSPNGTGDFQALSPSYGESNP